MLYCTLCVSDDLTVLSGRRWVLIWISFFFSSSPLFCPVSDVGNATPPSGSGLFMFFISFTCACLSLTCTVSSSSSHFNWCQKTLPSTLQRQIKLDLVLWKEKSIPGKLQLLKMLSRQIYFHSSWVVCFLTRPIVHSKLWFFFGWHLTYRLTQD